MRESLFTNERYIETRFFFLKDFYFCFYCFDFLKRCIERCIKDVFDVIKDLPVGMSIGIMKVERC